MDQPATGSWEFTPLERLRITLFLVFLEAVAVEYCLYLAFDGDLLKMFLTQAFYWMLFVITAPVFLALRWLWMKIVPSPSEESDLEKCTMGEMVVTLAIIGALIVALLVL